MRSIHSGLMGLALTLCVISPAHAVCDETDSILDQACKHVTNTWNEGGNDLYLPFHTYHLRSAYSSQKIDSFREDNWGLGYGRSRYTESGNWEGLYAMAFLDSHSNVEPMVGYGYQWIWGQREALHAGLGYSVLWSPPVRISATTRLSRACCLSPPSIIATCRSIPPSCPAARGTAMYSSSGRASVSERCVPVFPARICVKPGAPRT